MSKTKGKTLQQLIESGSFEEVQSKLFSLGEGTIIQIGLVALESFLEKNKDYAQREKFISTMLDKINIFESGKQLKVTNFTPIKALCLKTIGLDTLNNKKDTETKDIKFLRHEAALKSLESASKLYQDLLESLNNPEDKNKYSHHELEIQSLITKMIVDYKDLEEGVRLAEISSAQRKANFDVTHPNTLQALILLSKIGTESTVYETQIKCLNDAELAYNTICTNTISKENVSQIKTLLGHMSTIYSIFGDNGKAQEIKHYSTKTVEDLEGRTLILKKGLTDIATLKVKSLLQEKVLNPIQVAAAKAKWHEEWGVSSVTKEYGVAGYVEEDYLKKILGTNFTEANHKIALSLCFEAINIGIMSSSNKNPLTAAIFCIKYPALINEILDSHPEYFVDGYLLKTSLLNASDYSKKLLGEEDITVNSSYNKLFEEAIIPFVTERIKPTVLTPLKELVAGDGWSSWHTSKANYYLSDDFLLNGYILSASALGKNLGQIPDIINIARILAFKTIAETITERSITNLTPIEIFAKTFPELNTRIMEDHKEYYAGNNFILKLCANAQKQYLGRIGVEEMDLFSSVILSPQKTGEIKLLGDVPKDDQADNEHNDVS